MIYICSHTTPKYQLDYTHVFINNNDTDNPVNIAHEGNRYRHLRGIYNLYKNYSLSEEIGIFQYKRYFSIRTIPEGYRCVLPISKGNISIIHTYKTYHHIEDLLTLEKIVNDKAFSDYIRLQTDEQYYHNMFILRKPDFYNYCSYVFNFLFEFDKVTSNITYEGYDESVCAFLGERLGSYWIYKNIPKDERYLAEVVTCE